MGTSEDGCVLIPKGVLVISCVVVIVPFFVFICVFVCLLLSLVIKSDGVRDSVCLWRNQVMAYQFLRDKTNNITSADKI